MDLSKYELSIQKAIKDFENAVEGIISNKAKQTTRLKGAMQNIQRDLSKLKEELSQKHI
ncbi:MAG: hypothetical protein ACI9CD_000823 [Candidatus Deianiraeaceae bacterium]|jgi:hypothetical protein